MNERSIFVEAVKRQDPHERSSYLNAACDKNPELRSRIEALLQKHEHAGRFLEDPAAATVGVTINSIEPFEAGVGSVIDRYKLLELVGEGGFGDVYMAEQQEPVRRNVALKIIKLGMDTRQVIARFEAERQALALMDHANIAKVFEAGATATGRPYFVMELVRGLPITEYCDANNLTTQERLQLFIGVCHAVGHAHQKGIIHRDLKPTNVLVTQQNWNPIPKIIDFGVAKATQQRLTEKTLFTEHRQLVGTPEYMSPEQATFGESDVDTRSDIYSLGVLLYELIVGTTPFDAEQLRSRGYDEICRVIRENEPPTPSRRLSALGEAITEVCQLRQAHPAALRKLVHGDLDWIVMKCLEKDRTQRYETVNALARDIQRHINTEPIEARAPSPVYRLQKSIRKHRVPVAAALAVLVAICVGFVVATVGFLAAVEQRDLANKQRDLANTHADRANSLATQSNRLLYVSDMNSAYQAWDQGNFQRVRELLTRHGDDRALEEDRRGFEWHYLRSQYQNLSATPTLPHGTEVKSVAFSPDGTTVASGDFDGLVKLWDVATQKLRWTLEEHTDVVDLLAFAPGGKILASSSHDHTVRLWDVATGKSYGDVLNTDANVRCITFSQDGKTLTAVSEKGRIHQWNIETGRPVSQLPSLDTSIKLAAISPSGGTCVSGHKGSAPLQLWDLNTQRKIATVEGHKLSVNSVAISLDGKTLATGGVVDTVRLWDITDASQPKRLRSIPARQNLVWSLAFSPDGRTLVGGGGDKTVKLWDVKTGALLTTLRGHADWIYSVAFSADGKKLAAGGKDRTVKIWDLGEITEKFLPAQPFGIEETSLAFSPDGKTLAFTCGDDTTLESRYGQVTLWDVDTGKVSVLMELATPTTAVAFSPDRATLAVGVDAWNSPEDVRTGEIRLVDLSSETVASTLTGHTDRVTSVVFSSDGKTLASASFDGTLRLWSVSSGKQLRELKGELRRACSVAFSPDGKTLASGHRDVGRHRGHVQLWDVATETNIKKITDYAAPVFSVAFSPDGHTLASASGDSTVRLLDTKTYDETVLRGHATTVWGVAFSPDGKTLASSGRFGAVKLWHVATGQELATLGQHPTMSVIAFSPDGKTLAAACQDKTIALWRTKADKTRNSLLGSVVLRAPPPVAKTKNRRSE